jgi:hypothetical protein
MAEMTLENHERLAENLLAYFRERAPKAELIQTHISSVILAGDYAYKIKKPVDLQFLDFSTLARRKFYCQEELRLNRRLAPELYVDVQAIAGTVDRPEPGGDGPAIDYLVRMRRFRQQNQLDRLLTGGNFPVQRMDELATLIADFHEKAARANVDADAGDPAALWAPVQQNFDQLRELIDDGKQRNRLETLRQWSQRRFRQLKATFRARKAAGLIREGHGDMHLRNIALMEDRFVIFDGIEFNESFRWIDVIDDLAFLIMDLRGRGLNAWANRLLNRYLEITGDYGGLEVLAFYTVYRALVRVKVGAIRLAESRLDARQRQRVAQELDRDLALAESLTRPGTTYVAITHGVSGSGKSTAALWLVETFGAIRLRSDAERQRLFATARSKEGDSVNSGRYSPKTTRALYEHLAGLAKRIVELGHGVIVDASFLKQYQRNLLARVAESLNIPWIIVDMQCRREIAARRIHRRRAEGTDISEADGRVLDMQLETAEPLDAGERDSAIDGDCAEAEARNGVEAAFAGAAGLPPPEGARYGGRSQ